MPPAREPEDYAHGLAAPERPQQSFRSDHQIQRLFSYPKWWARVDLNNRLLRCERSTLTTELRAHVRSLLSLPPSVGDGWLQLPQAIFLPAEISPTISAALGILFAERLYLSEVLSREPVVGGVDIPA